MALTPEDVINKRFQPTKFREGYDQDEVDDFLDEIVVELRRINQENDALRKQVETLGGRPEESAVETSAVSQSTEDVQETTSTPAASVTETSGTTVSEPVRVSDEQSASTAATVAPSAGTTSSAQPAATQTAPTTESAESAAAVLAMAQKLHDDYVSQGQAERERLITEGRTQADQLVADGKRTKEETLSSLEREKVDLEASVAQLRSFEEDYRGNLKSFLNAQLNDLANTGSLEPADAPVSATTKRTGTK
ncbi:DivIVA domain-containing protein [Kocuria indica]|uniref:Cell wall synthesis protein Wag31 n=1 Tax=Kocuria marina subsp. indica TaxID=1049583 RepID=A0A6N9QVM3_9MICC|nr:MULTISPECIES: DivIVA domain-containing protein [Kocuria]MCT1615011.1 DivIVA domain-containing protein [Kocuria marina]NDO76737.1 DivIVA domain-containing protein [Kocuria indica]